MVRELLPPGTGLAFEAMRELRPDWSEREAFARQVDEVQRPEGYRLVGAFDDDDDDDGDGDGGGGGEQALAVAGFRVLNHLAWGRTLYVDDLSTRPAARRRGHGAALLEWCAEEATRLGCDQLHLDSGVGPERADAHRLYFNQGMRISSHHFAKRV